ncbi:MAG: hypothetical protein M1457_10885 [bacterium]|nr:hypothetical protein [bacterium]
MTRIPTAGPDMVQRRRKFLLHLKCLLWCVHQMHTRYDLNLVLYSLEHESVHPEIKDSNLGDNLAHILDHLEPEDVARLSQALARLPESIGAMDIGDKHFEIGHYIQALQGFGPITEGAYGVITAITPQLRGLFYLEGARLIEAPFAPSAIRVIFGTYIV